MYVDVGSLYLNKIYGYRKLPYEEDVYRFIKHCYSKKVYEYREVSSEKEMQLLLREGCRIKRVYKS